MRRLLVLFVLVTAISVGTGVQGAETPLAAVHCANCHGPEGRIDGPIPAIAGKPASLLADRLRDFKADRVPGATIMPRLTKGLTDAEIEQVARYFAAMR